VNTPLCMVVGALGGEGGGVLSDWIVSLARAQGYIAQSTSIPGVAQRTGATTYYIELFKPEGVDTYPVLALTPTPGHVDVILASELLEAARAAQNGLVTPERTTVIASVHRVFAIAEKISLGDGRFDVTKAETAVRELAKDALLFDMEQITKQSGAVISSVMFGGLAGSGALPFGREAFEAVIRETGKAVDTNLRGFALGFEAVKGPSQSAQTKDPKSARSYAVADTAALLAEVESDFVAKARSMIGEGVNRLVDYQDAAYAKLYLDRLRTVADALLAANREKPAWGVLTETARHLALRMSYEDVMRVADLKSRRSRHERVRAEVKPGEGEPLVIAEFLKPGLEEFAAFLPDRLGGWMLGAAERAGIKDKLRFGMHLKSTSITGFLTLRALARLRALRRWSWRYAREQENIEGWLDAVRQAIDADAKFAGEIVECAGLIKGYGSTNERGFERYNAIMEQVVKPALAEGRIAAKPVRQAREAALADPDGNTLQLLLEKSAAAPAKASKGQVAA